MPTIPCYRCGHPISLSPESGAGPDVCPNCGHNFAVGKSPPPPWPGSDKGGEGSGTSTGTDTVLAMLLGFLGAMAKPLAVWGAVDVGGNIWRGAGNGLVAITSTYVLAIIAATICRIFGKPFRSTFNSAYYLSIIVVSLVLFSAVLVRVTGGSAEKTKQEKQAAGALAQDFDVFREAVRISDETGKPIELNLRPVEDQSTEAGKDRLIGHMNFKAMADLQNAYLNALAETGMDTVLDPERLVKDKGLKDSREILAKGKAVVQEYRRKFEEHVRTFPDTVKAMPNSPVKDAASFMGFKMGYQQNLKAGLRMWQLENETIGTIGEMVEILAASEGKWTVDEGKFMFEEDEALEKFNAVVAKAQTLGDEQEKIRQEAFSKGKAQLEKMAK